ncbi:hypothetical protein RRG08_029268 [Elysia crispata]|uniref:Uncharacterized protein n=1 Tax=Elysia crispata TaxID=231223 RepID=A0AAE1DZJ8_9GAST|nr:hypothetical protein RRG08_029268 [Elysia crispata]
MSLDPLTITFWFCILEEKTHHSVHHESTQPGLRELALSAAWGPGRPDERERAAVGDGVVHRLCQCWKQSHIKAVLQALRQNFEQQQNAL